MKEWGVPDNYICQVIYLKMKPMDGGYERNLVAANFILIHLDTVSECAYN